MPESKKRKKSGAAASGAVRPTKKPGPSPRWLAPLMLAMFGIGVLWLVVFYVTANDSGGMPLTGGLGNGNLAIGFGFIVVGFALSTQWR